MTHISPEQARISGAAALDAHSVEQQRAALMALLHAVHAAENLRELDATGLLTRLIPELEPARDTDQPHVHFLPVLAHSLEAVAVVDWLLTELGGTQSGQSTGSVVQPAAVQRYNYMHYRSLFSQQLAEHFANAVGRYARPALFRLGALLHDIAKPQTKETKPDGSVSFHEHQSIGGEVAMEIAQRFGFNQEEIAYIRAIVREHMRPGQLYALPELTERAVRRFFQDIGEDAPDVLLFLLADHMATRGPQIDVGAWFYQARWVDAMLDVVWGQEEEATPALLNGHDLIQELGMHPGPLIGRVLAVVGEAQAQGEIATREQALALAHRILARETE